MLCISGIFSLAPYWYRPDVVDEQGRLVAHATSICMTLREGRS
jgi:hypothetical protein